MVIAALISFGILLVAWVLAPSEGVEQIAEVAPESELAPVAA